MASHLYPSELSRTSGSFVHNQIRFLAEHCDPVVVSPTPYFPFPGFGRWSRYRELARRESADGLDVHRPRYLTLPRRIALGRAWKSYDRALESVNLEADLIHVHCAYPDGLAGVTYGKRHGIPVVITVHGHDLKDLAIGKPRWRSLVERALIGANAVIAVSEELQERARDLGVEDRCLHRIPNGIEGELFRFDPSERVPGEGGWRIVYVGRYDEAKGLVILLDAVAALVAEGRDLRLDLVGGGKATGTGDVFRAQAARLGIADRVDFVDEVPWREVPKHLNKADLFVLPSFSEGLPLSLLEALACGLPIVATRCGGPEEVVDDEVGRLVEPRDVPGLAGAIADVLDSHSCYDREAIAARACREYDYRSVARRIVDVYKSVMAEPVAASTSR
ncbi:MAG: glycosyltransferase [Candidatus Latescibacterota bacterium]|nr:glycosyltransferase [Candidatus Latescibacterota bacterium]